VKWSDVAQDDDAEMSERKGEKSTLLQLEYPGGHSLLHHRQKTVSLCRIPRRVVWYRGRSQRK